MSGHGQAPGTPEIPIGNDRRMLGGCVLDASGVPEVGERNQPKPPFRAESTTALKRYATINKLYKLSRLVTYLRLFLGGKRNRALLDTAIVYHRAVDTRNRSGHRFAVELVSCPACIRSHRDGYLGRDLGLDASMDAVHCAASG